MFQVKATIEKISTLANHCISILIHTGDISKYSGAELSKIFDLRGDEKEVWVAFKELEVKEQDLNIEDNLDMGKQKSPHKELYDLCLAYKKLQTGKFDGAREMYVEVMKKMSNQVRDKIEDLKLTK